MAKFSWPVVDRINGVELYFFVVPSGLLTDNCGLGFFTVPQNELLSTYMNPLIIQR